MTLGFITPLYRAWLGRQAAFLSFRAGAARLYKETRAADMLSGTGTPPSPAACLDYHARQLIRHAKYGKATLYGRRRSGTAMEPIGRNNLWSGRFNDEMTGWITENGTEYTDLSVRPHELGRVIRSVRQAVKDHDALLAWCRRHAAGSSH
jgi:hypothetical protein